MDDYGIKPTVSQADRLKKLSQSDELTTDLINEILSEVKGTPKDKGEGENGISQYRKYFPNGFTDEQMNAVIIKLLQNWDSQGKPELGESA
jgi:ParB family chromosome partitioning protein